MTTIYSYRKHITREITRELRLPATDGVGDCIELATIDSVTYVCIPAGVSLPAEQPTEIVDSIAPVVLTNELRDQLKAASPHVRLINARVQERISERYSMAEEIKLLRTAPSPEMDAYNAYAEECRAWGRAEKARLGL